MTVVLLRRGSMDGCSLMFLFLLPFLVLSIGNYVSALTIRLHAVVSVYNPSLPQTKRVRQQGGGRLIRKGHLLSPRGYSAGDCNALVSLREKWRLYAKNDNNNNNSPIITQSTSSSSKVGNYTSSFLSLKLHVQDYLELMRFTTLFQAVGALVVGCLAISWKHRPSLSSLLSVYLSYGAGMVANDCVDSSLVDALHDEKKHRPIPSGRITLQQAWRFTVVLVVSSVAFAMANGWQFSLWTASNLILMLGYALGLQKVFLLKNILVGWLGISPLGGAVFLSLPWQLQQQPKMDYSLHLLITSATCSPLYRLGAIGFAVGVAREILKDMEDYQVDALVGKKTLPGMVGNLVSHRISYGLVAAVCIACYTPGYRILFSSPPFPIYMTANILSTIMCLRASSLPLKNGQRLLKKSIYVLLAGMIGALLLQ